MFGWLLKNKRNPTIKMNESGNSLVLYAIVGKKVVTRMTCTLDKKKILICDIVNPGMQESHRYNRYINNGYGSKLMEALLSYAEEHDFDEVYGNLAIIDREHKERLHHFYEKFGFEITEYSVPNNSYYGMISKKIAGKTL